jgi:hypothetical protein
MMIRTFAIFPLKLCHFQGLSDGRPMAPGLSSAFSSGQACLPRGAALCSGPAHQVQGQQRKSRERSHGLKELLILTVQVCLHICIWWLWPSSSQDMTLSLSICMCIYIYMYTYIYMLYIELMTLSINLLVRLFVGLIICLSINVYPWLGRRYSYILSKTTGCFPSQPGDCFGSRLFVFGVWVPRRSPRSFNSRRTKERTCKTEEKTIGQRHWRN